MKAFLVLAVVLTAANADRGATRPPVLPFESPTNTAPQGKIDELVFSKLKHLGIPPAPVCSDAVFVRRVYLDVIGTLPTAQETKDFISDQNPKKRKLLIDRLLERKEFADYWAMKWSDLLRVKSEFPINLWPNAVQAYHRWIRTCIKDNMPYDRFVREMLTASGSNFDVPQVNFYRAIQSREPTAIAQAVALTFMGVRAESWPSRALVGMAHFFRRSNTSLPREWKEEIVIFDPGKARPVGGRRPVEAVFPDGTPAQLLPGPGSPRSLRRLADRAKESLVRPQHREPHLVLAIGARNYSRARRHPPGQSARNPELLAYLERELVAAHYDLKHLYRLILNSKTYQLSSIPETDHPQGDGQFRALSAAPSGSRGAYRRHLPDHRHDGEIFKPHSRALHIHSRKPTLDRTGRRQHRQFVPGDVRPPGPRHGPGIGARTIAPLPPSNCTCSIRRISAARSNKAPRFETYCNPGTSREISWMSFISRFFRVIPPTRIDNRQRLCPARPRRQASP